MSEMSTTNTREFLEQAIESGRWFRVAGYRSSDGSISDMEVRHVGLAGYRGLIKEAHQQLVAGELKLDGSSGWSPAQIEEAAGELQASWETSIAKPLENEFPDLQSRGDGWVIIHLEQRVQSVTQVGDLPARPRNSGVKTLIKERLRDMSALNRFVGRLNLLPDKFQTLTWV